MRPPLVLLSCFLLHLLPVSPLSINEPPANLITLPSNTNNTNTNNNNNNNNILPSAYTAECVRITDPPMIGLNPTNCDIAIGIICHRLTGPRPTQLVRDKWIWAELPSCSLGYYLPEDAYIPYLGQCQKRFEEIVELCSTDSRFNAGGMNVREMPDFSGDGEGIVEEGVRFAMAPERLTLPG
ncbi:MAG: hypothetical protein Q9161_008320 [Pseudevernia consocians]